MRISFVRYVVVTALFLTAAGAVGNLLDDSHGAFNTIASYPEQGEKHAR